MTTRTKLCIGVGLVFVAVGVVVFTYPRAESASVSVSFVRYTGDGGALLDITNRGSAVVSCQVWDIRERRAARLEGSFELMPRSGTQLVVRPFLSEFPVEVACVVFPHPSTLRETIDNLLSKVGIDSHSTNAFIATVDLPPRAARTSLGSTNQSAP